MKYRLLLSIILVSHSGRAQLTFDSFETLLEYADTHAYAIKSSKLNEQLALSEKKEAGAYLLPYGNLSLGYNDNITLQPTLVPAQAFNPQAPEGEFQELTFGMKYQYLKLKALMEEMS